jgi:hypothetical protein
MSDGNPLETISEKVSESAASVAESLGDRVAGSNIREDEQYLLPPDLKQALVEPIKDLGFPLGDNPGRVRDYSGKWHNFYQCPVKGGYLAILYVRNKLLESAVHGNNFAWIGALFSQNGAKGMFIFSDSTSIAPTFGKLEEDWEERLGFNRAKFFSKSYVDELIAGDLESKKSSLSEWFKLSSFVTTTRTSTPSLTFEDLKNSQEKIDKIVSIIANAAANALGNPQDYFPDLVRRTDWSREWQDAFAGTLNGLAPDVAARKLVGWALARKISKKNPSFTTIGALFEPLIRIDLDREDGLYLFQLIQEHGLITEPDIIQKIHDECFGP